jgi:hypothetical protein
MSIPPVFPSTYSIPPATFYNIQGIATWLNNNPTYKQYFTSFGPFNLYSNTNLFSYEGYTNYNVQNVPLAPNVVTLSQTQRMIYTEQIETFQRVYAYNSNAYVSSLTGTAPIYYRFQNYQEHMKYKASVSLINKLYPFAIMANGKNTNGSTLGWIVPFPL